MSCWHGTRDLRSDSFLVEGSPGEYLGRGRERTSGVSRTHVEARRGMVQRDLQLLEHEQLHFDLTEIAVRRIRKRFVELKSACDDPDGREELRHMIAEIDRELQEEQCRYDRETSHGTNAVAQDQWKRRIRKQLEQP